VRAYFFLSFFRFCSLRTFLDTRHFLDTALAGAWSPRADPLGPMSRSPWTAVTYDVPGPVFHRATCRRPWPAAFIAMGHAGVRTSRVVRHAGVGVRR
jgi:hypothetical protein